MVGRGGGGITALRHDNGKVTNLQPYSYNSNIKNKVVGRICRTGSEQLGSTGGSPNNRAVSSRGAEGCLKSLSTAASIVYGSI